MALDYKALRLRAFEEFQQVISSEYSRTGIVPGSAFTEKALRKSLALFYEALGGEGGLDAHMRIGAEVNAEAEGVEITLKPITELGAFIVELIGGDMGYA